MINILSNNFNNFVRRKKLELILNREIFTFTSLSRSKMFLYQIEKQKTLLKDLKKIFYRLLRC